MGGWWGNDAVGVGQVVWTVREVSDRDLFQEFFDARIIVDLGGKEEKTAEAA